MNLVVKRGRAFDEIDSTEFYSYIESEACKKRSDYAQILKNWLNVFPREQMFIGLYEDISNHPKGLLRNVFNFLEVATDVDWSHFPFNEVIMPRYESYGGVRSGYVAEKRFATEYLLPDELKKQLEQMYTPRIIDLVESYDLPVHTWLPISGS